MPKAFFCPIRTERTELIPNGFSAASCATSLRLPRYNRSQILVMPTIAEPRLSLSVTSHQLARLRRMRLVASRDESRLTYYRATDEFVGHLVHDSLAHASATLGVQNAPHHHPHRVPRPRKRMQVPTPDRRRRGLA
jgi:hypothetical protein